MQLVAVKRCSSSGFKSFDPGGAQGDGLELLQPERFEQPGRTSSITGRPLRISRRMAVVQQQNIPTAKPSVNRR